MVQLSRHWTKKKSKNIVQAFWKNLAQSSDRHGWISDLASKGFIYLGGFFVFNFFNFNLINLIKININYLIKIKINLIYF